MTGFAGLVCLGPLSAHHGQPRGVGPLQLTRSARAEAGSGGGGLGGVHH